MANQLLTTAKITEESLMVLENELNFSKQVNKQYDKYFALAGGKIGATLNVRRPARYIGTVGPTLNVEDHTETSLPVTIATQFHVDTQFTTADLTLSLDRFSERVVSPAMATIANKIDRDGAQQFLNQTYTTVGTVGSPPTALSTYLTAQAFLDAEAVPRDGKRSVVLEPFSMSSTVSGLSTLFNNQQKVGEQYNKGMMGMNVAGIDMWKMDQNIVSQTFGSWSGAAGTITINGAGQGLATGWAYSSTLNLSVTQGLTLNAGDVFTIQGVQGVNPQNRQTYGRARQFVIQSAVTSAGAGNITVTVVPALIYAGQFQNCNITPAAGATVTPFNIGTGGIGNVSPQNALFHRDALCLVMADLELPEGVHMRGRSSDNKAGLSIRLIRQYTINNDSIPARFDVLYGWSPLYPEFGLRIAA